MTLRAERAKGNLNGNYNERILAELDDLYEECMVGNEEHSIGSMLQDYDGKKFFSKPAF